MAGLPGIHNTAARIGSVYRLTIEYVDNDGNPVDLTGYTINMPIRRTRSGGLIHHASTAADGDITITDAPGGTAIVEIPATTTDDWKSQTGVYDVNLTPPSGAAGEFAILTGSFEIKPRVDPEEA